MAARELKLASIQSTTLTIEVVKLMQSAAYIKEKLMSLMLICSQIWYVKTKALFIRDKPL